MGIGFFSPGHMKLLEEMGKYAKLFFFSTLYKWKVTLLLSELKMHNLVCHKINLFVNLSIVYSDDKYILSQC